MKVTLEIPSELLASAKQVAEKRGTKLSALVEEGLRLVLRDRTSLAQPQFRLADRRVHGKPRALGESLDWRRLEDSLVRERVMRSARDLPSTLGSARCTLKSRKF